MKTHLRVVLATLVSTVLLAVGLGTAHAAETLSVEEAIANNTGKASVTGYIVGEPQSSDSVVHDNFSNDYAFALADDAGATDTDSMLYVQLPKGLRAEWGLASNPDLMGQRVTVTGDLTAYFAHAGVKNTTEVSGDSTQPTPTPTPTTSPEPSETPAPTPTPTTSPEPSETPEPTPTATADPTSDPTGYWAEANGKEGAELKAAVNQIISGHNELSYKEVWDALKETDADPNQSGNVLLLYSGRSQSASSNGGGADDWNREHVWAKSHGDFGTAMGPGTDIHHLRPTDTTVNSTRSNKDFDNGGEPVDEAEDCLTDGDSFEPRDEVKGDVARMIMYMAVRYEGTDGEPDLELNDQVDNGKAPYMGKQSVLLEWHAQDPVDDFERNRNDVIQDWQGNRNPFIDHPEWAGSIFA